MRLEDYKHFDAELFLKDRKYWETRKQSLTDELESMSLFPSAGNGTGIRGSNISDPTRDHAIRRAEVVRRIEEIQDCEKAYDYAMKKMTEEEQLILNGFFEPKTAIWKFVRKWEEEHFVSTSAVYKARRKALEKFGEILEDLISWRTIE